MLQEQVKKNNVEKRNCHCRIIIKIIVSVVVNVSSPSSALVMSVKRESHNSEHKKNNFRKLFFSFFHDARSYFLQYTYIFFFVLEKNEDTDKKLWGLKGEWYWGMNGWEGVWIRTLKNSCSSLSHFTLTKRSTLSFSSSVFYCKLREGKRSLKK